MRRLALLHGVVQHVVLAVSLAVGLRVGVAAAEGCARYLLVGCSAIEGLQVLRVVLRVVVLLLPHHAAGTVRLSEVRHDVVATLRELQRPG